jgi:glycogen debranching enzyme
LLDYNLVLKSNELFTAGNTETDGSRELANGLYLRDTRHLSYLILTMNGLRTEKLAITQESMTAARIVASNPFLTLDDDSRLVPQQVMITEEIHLDRNLTVDIAIESFTMQPCTFEVGIDFTADFRDLFDIRGFVRAERGHLNDPVWNTRTCRLSYTGIDQRQAATEVRFDQDAQFEFEWAEARAVTHALAHLPPHLRPTKIEPDDVPMVSAAFPISLEPRGVWRLSIQVMPVPPAGPPMVEHPEIWPTANLVTSDLLLNHVLRQSTTDLTALDTAFPNGSLCAAGIPWFVAPFGRDSLITALQTLHVTPQRAISTLRTLASLQGAVVDERKEEEPGKIPHEMRYGEMARMKEVPHTPYYGSIDATPLWLWVFAETVLWTGNQALFDELRGNAERALAWCRDYGDLDGDGLIEYRTDHQGAGKISHQVWKDSFDSLNHADGNPAAGPIAAVEVQGYAYAGYRRLAACAARFGDSAWADELNARADAVQRVVEDKFWIEADAMYAQALDYDKCPVTVPNSNAGHLLACELPAPDRGILLAHRMCDRDMMTEWGIRTLGSGAVRYNPLSYHNGSIWPHDNSLIGYGCFRYRQFETGMTVVRALIDSALSIDSCRLPELYCGFNRIGVASDTPLPYPVSCSPQAWAAGSLPFLLRGMLGLTVEDGALVCQPWLPDWLEQITLTSVEGAGSTWTVTVSRDAAATVQATVLPT